MSSILKNNQYLILTYNLEKINALNLPVHFLPTIQAGPTLIFPMRWIEYCTWTHPIIWQYGLWSFQMGGAKLERFLPKKQHPQRKLLNFENWVNGEVSKIGHHFSK